MKCPHCLVGFFEGQTRKVDPLRSGKNEDYLLVTYLCPNCEKLVVQLRIKHNYESNYTARLVYPRVTSREPISEHVPSKYADDYKEACLVLVDSPKASAALSRRCLQLMIWDEFKIKKRNLDLEIQEVLDNNVLPSHIAEALDAVRHIGNFAAHAQKSTNTGEILDVEEGEAEWSLEVIEFLFDHCFVQPAILKKKRDELNKKLEAAGKPSLKDSVSENNKPQSNDNENKKNDSSQSSDNS